MAAAAENEIFSLTSTNFSAHVIKRPRTSKYDLKRDGSTLECWKSNDVALAAPHPCFFATDLCFHVIGCLSVETSDIARASFTFNESRISCWICIRSTFFRSKTSFLESISPQYPIDLIAFPTTFSYYETQRKVTKEKQQSMVLDQSVYLFILVL